MEPFHALQRTDSDGNAFWVHFARPLGCVEAWKIDEVLPALRVLEGEAKKGNHAVGWIAYEASPAFDPHYQVHPLPEGTPLLRFTVYEEQRQGLPRRHSGPFDLSPLTPGLDLQAFRAAVTEIHQAIARGETYQVNFTYPLKGHLAGDPWSLFRQLRQAQASQHQAYIEEPDRVIICASPERFFRHQGEQIFCKPMKGTAAIGQDAFLKNSVKNRSENIMIVDMIRNDLGKRADPGSVKADPLFEVAQYPSLLQMTSTVSATGSASAVDWLTALFPCASITGAPKQKTMEWIYQLETGPRGIYTGCIGGFYGDGITEFNVAIRTGVLEPQTGTLHYHCGCGIVWDSDPEEEYRESLLKAEVLTHKPLPFALIETMRYETGIGIKLWPYHRQRLLRSAAAIGFELDVGGLDQRIASLKLPKLGKVRLTLSDARNIEIETADLPETDEPWCFSIDTQPTLSTHPELKHKSTRRNIYQAARARCPEVDETLLINERGELMEFSIGNLVWVHQGQAYTPPLSSGMLPGVARAAGLAEGKLIEKVCRKEDLDDADEIYLINALRGWVRMEPQASALKPL
jgi:para-aminobenzoate synthetase / 4-amino-4-deoxychorismate lyase